VSLAADRAGSRAQREFAAQIMQRGAEPNRLMVFSAHQMGTCRMHRDPRRGVVDGGGAVHGVRGVIVTDASVFPLAAGINPMLPIMAVSRRTASMHAALS
jgi:choline dehydrogenase-like flavoprotein